MNVSQINNSVPLKGLYFVKGKPLFNKAAEGPGILSKSGVRYIEDTNISEKVKEKFANNTFIKSLAEKFDTFISFHQEKTEYNYNEYFSYATISWFDKAKSILETRKLAAFSEISNKLSSEKLFDRLTRKQFL